VDLRAGFVTDRGRVREANEDCVLADADRGLFVVADGMGGHAAGEVASAIAVRTLGDEVARFAASATYPFAEEDVRETIAAAVRKANEAIAAKSLESPATLGMGTTLTALFLWTGRWVVAHVGDSRAYLLRGGSMSRITSDHSYVAELVREGLISDADARVHPKRNLITRSLGTQSRVDADFFSGEAMAGDVFLLCSDGLTGELPDASVASILAATNQPEPAARLLIESANRAGGRDNVSAIVVRVEA
jgi:protein phosphatase